MDNIINIHVGQCGLNIGQQIWNDALEEHHIDPNSGKHDSITDKGYGAPHKLNTLFDETKEGTYTPRALFVSPKEDAIAQVQSSSLGSIIPKENFMCQGPQLDHNWAKGMYGSKELKEAVVGKARSMAESLSNFGGFHFIGGITGSGGGALLAGLCSDLICEFPDRDFTITSVFPTQTDYADILGVYNTVCTLHYLVENGAGCHMVTNTGASKVAQNLGIYGSNNLDSINKVISKAFLASTANQRYKVQYDATTLNGINQRLVLFPRLHFYTINYFSSSTASSEATVNNLISPEYSLTGIDPLKDSMLSSLAVFRGSEFDTFEVQRTFQKIKEEKSQSLFKEDQYAFCSVMNNNSKSNEKSVNEAVQLGNSCSIAADLFKPLEAEFDKNFQAKVQMQSYFDAGMDEMEFTEAQCNYQDLMAEYEQYGQANQSNDDDVSDEDDI